MIQTYIKERLPHIEAKLASLVPEESTAHRILSQAARYSLLGGGKRIRPLLTLATVDALGADWQLALTPACAIEMIHTYSLIHDDLPCMDDDDFRRGKPSLHKEYSEGIATLAGDFLLTHAFYVLASDPHLNATQKMKMIQGLSSKAGGSGMIAGQILDIEAERQSIELSSLKNIHSKKTGKLIAAALECGAIAASADEHVQKELCHFGEEIGLAFQIIDDVIDVTNSEIKHGKKESSDQLNGKTTYVTLLGVEASQKLARQHLEASTEILRQLKLEDSILNDFSQLLVMRKI
ncbi:Farnesyl diphosphate synthase [Chlamydiales bacterium STE3]|nr:Farnesyl diphosphate synthase [Chlamydiales bacterium STE3]